MLHNTLHIQSNNYNASTNTPALATATGYNDNIFQVTTQGIQTINGVSSFCGVGDEIVVSVGVSKFFTVMPVQYNASTSVVGTLAVTITQLQQVGRIITISVDGTQTINGVATNMAVGQAWEYNGVSWLNIISEQAKMVAVQTASSSNLMTRIIYPTDAYYNSIQSAGVQTGAICITLPVAIKVFNTMFKMTVNIYDYNQPTTTSSIYIAGYWSGGIAAWSYPSATITSGSLNANFPISFGVNGSGVPCIYIGKVTSTWSAVMRVSIDNLLASYSGATIAHLSSGWNIGIVDSIVGTPIVLDSNFTQAKGLYDIDAAGNVLTQVNSTSARFTGPISTYPLSTYKVNSQLYNRLFITSQLSGDLSYQQLMFSPTANSAGGNGWARLYKYDADGLNPTYKLLFSMDPDTGVVGFSYIPTAPTAALGDNTTQLATTAFVIANANPTSSYATQAEVNAGTITNKAIAPSTFAASTQLAAKAPLASPALTGTPTVPTAAIGTNTTQAASTAFVIANANPTSSYATQAEVNAGTITNKAIAPSTFAASTQLAAKAPLASPALTGIPTAPTAALGTNTTQVASTAFVLANANTSDSYATQAQVNAGVVSNLAIAPSTFAASSQLAAKANANNIHFAGDTKLSFQATNHASGNGMWMIANGQSIPTQYTQAIAIFGANLPNITDAVIGVAGGSHLSGTGYGANAVAVPVSSHNHGMSIYNGHTHSMNAYNAHTHGDDHKHNDTGHGHADAGHSHVDTVVGEGGAFGTKAASWGDNYQSNRVSASPYPVSTGYAQIQTGYANINYKSQVSGQSASTSAVNNAGTNVTDAVNYANSRTDDSGTAGVTMSVLQPTYYTKNLFIFCC